MVDDESGLLRSSPAFRRYWTARLISVIGDGAAEISLVLYVAGLRGAGRNVGLVLLAASVPRFFGPLLGTIADRVDRRTVLVTADLLQAGIYSLIALTLPPMPVLLLLIALAAVCATAFGSAARGAVPALVAPGQLMRANAWLATANNVQIILGPALGGVLFGSIGVRGALAADAASFVVSALIVAGLPRLPILASSEFVPGFFSEAREGLRYAMRNPTIRAIVLLLFFGVAFGALDNVALVFLARGPLHAGPIGYGVLAASFGVGMIAGSVSLLRRNDPSNSRAVLMLGWLLCGGGLIGTGLSPLIVVAVLTQIVAGAGNGLSNVAEETLLQQVVEPHYLGRVGGLLSAAGMLGASTAYAVGGFAVEVVSPRTLFVLAGSGVVVVTLLLRRSLRPLPAS